MRVAASDISTQDTSTDIVMEVTNYMTMKCASSVTEPLAFWQQHSGRFPMLSKVVELYLAMSSASVAVEAMFPKTAGKHNRISFMTIMHTCLILNRNEPEWFFFYFVTLSLLSLMWTLLFDLNKLTLLCPARSVLYYSAGLCEVCATCLSLGLFQYSNFQYFRHFLASYI